MHIPSFWHGWLEHSSTSFSHKSPWYPTDKIIEIGSQPSYRISMDKKLHFWQSLQLRICLQFSHNKFTQVAVLSSVAICCDKWHVCCSLLFNTPTAIFSGRHFVYWLTQPWCMVVWPSCWWQFSSLAQCMGKLV